MLYKKERKVLMTNALIFDILFYIKRMGKPLSFLAERLGGFFMKKTLCAMLAFFGAAGIFAYNPPAGGQNILRLSEPQLVTGANSCAGGGIFGVTPASIINNPALTAWEQRITLDAAGTIFVNTNSEDDKKLGSALEGGLLLPSRWCVSSFLFQGVWTEFSDMPIGDSLSFTGGFSKDITDEVSVGIAGNFAVTYGEIKSDWMASGSLGAYYNFGDLGFLKSLRFGLALTNLGRVFNENETLGIKGSEAEKWPGFCTLRAGLAGSLVKTDSFELGASMDFAAPTFQNFVFDTGVQILVMDFLKISSSWEFDLMEFKEESKNIMPSVGVSFKFNFNSSKDSYLAKKGWEQSEMTVSGSWKQMYENVNAISAGLLMNLGLKDTKAPEVSLWGE